MVMSASESPSPQVSPSGGDASSGAASEVALDAADIATLLAASQSGAWADTDGSNVLDVQAYDGHVALALDPGTLADIDLTLDLLTSSHQLFDVPVLDVSASDDVSPA
jgi:hypothetical protein